MKIIFLLSILLLLTHCTNGKQVFWCGDHACVNKKEKEAYFKKNMIVEVRKIGQKDKPDNSKLNQILKQIELDNKKGKDLKKETRLEKKRRIKEEKELIKQVRLEEKERIKEEKKLAKQALLEEKKINKKEKKSFISKFLKTKKESNNKKTFTKSKVAMNNRSSGDFGKIVEKITNQNKPKPYPSINDIPD